MAVYTDLREEVLCDFLSGYQIGTLRRFEGIAEGVENSNFLLETTEGCFILTLFERRMNPAELPWFLGLMGYLARKGITCPQPVVRRDGQILCFLAGRPAVIVSFLSGRSLTEIDVDACEVLGRALAALHQAGQGYTVERHNALGLEGWATLLGTCTAGGDRIAESLIQAAERALVQIRPLWPAKTSLPRGQIHADLFPDNVFFCDGQVSGVIDFYFACTDFLAYDLAICLNAWCFRSEKDFCPERARALLKGYESVRFLTSEERMALPLLCQGAALRFLLTRLYDWVNTPVGAVVTRKDPWAYQRRLVHFQECLYVG